MESGRPVGAMLICVAIGLLLGLVLLRDKFFGGGKPQVTVAEKSSPAPPEDPLATEREVLKNDRKEVIDDLLAASRAWKDLSPKLNEMRTKLATLMAALREAKQEGQPPRAQLVAVQELSMQVAEAMQSGDKLEELAHNKRDGQAPATSPDQASSPSKLKGRLAKQSEVLK